MTTHEVDAYLAALPANSRVVLEKLRKTIRAAAPGAVELISYMMPAFKYRGSPLVYYAAFSNHCSIFPASSGVIEMFKDELSRFETSKGTIRFPTDKPISSALVRKIVNARMAEIEAGAKEKPRKQKYDLPKLAAPAQRALAGAGIRDLKQLSRFSEARVKALHGIGPNALKELRAALKASGLSFSK